MSYDSSLHNTTSRDADITGFRRCHPRLHAGLRRY